jgi:hypothetical protein
MFRRTENIQNNVKENYQNISVFQKTGSHIEISKTKVDILTLHGLIRRMVRFATDKSFILNTKRLMAIKWISTITKAMGSQFSDLYSEKMYRKCINSNHVQFGL